MKTKNIILILILIIISSNAAYAIDFYPELGMDPFYSSLNPAHVQEDFVNKEDDTLMDIFKNKKEKSKDKKIKREKEIEINDIRSEDKTFEKESEKSNPIKKIFNIRRENKNEDKVVEDVEEDNNLQKLKENTDEEKKAVFVRPKNVKDLEDKEEKKFSLRDKLPFFKSKKKKETPQPDPKIELTADYMEYYPDRYEVEAIGNAKVVFTKEDTTLSANKIIFNYDRNVIKANENVVLSSAGTVTEGDFVKIDLSMPEGWIENPVTSTEDIKLTAKEAFVYSDRIEEYDGVAKILKNEIIAFRANSFASYVDQGGIFAKRFSPNLKDRSGVYSLKAKTIYIDSKKDHEVITIENADLYLKRLKIGAIPSARIVTNKQNTNIETNLPEIGSQNMLGAHIGPAVVLNVPGGATLKLAPILTYSKDKLGIGGIARFRNQYNMTELAYGTSRDELLLRGRHKLAPGLLLNYSRLTNQNEWFLGFRRPKYSAQLSYSRNDNVKDLKLNFSQMYTAGVFVDNLGGNVDFKDAEGRFRWMTQTFKPIYNYNNEEGNIGFNFGLVAQTLAGVYTTGDVQGLLRVGPAVSTKVGPWNQSLIYFQTAQAGESPFYFDRYRYGRSNVILIESLRVCKYLSLGYMASIAMNRDYHDDELFQENRILIGIGPDYARVTFGYDALRHNTMLIFSMIVGTKDSDITFKKTVLKNPEKFGKKNTKKKPKKKNYKKYLKETV